MAADLTPYPQELYLNGEFNLLKAERYMMTKVLGEQSFDLKKSYVILCPPDNALYTFRTFKVKIVKHKIPLPKDMVIKAK